MTGDLEDQIIATSDRPMNKRQNKAVDKIQTNVERLTSRTEQMSLNEEHLQQRAAFRVKAPRSSTAHVEVVPQ